MILVIYCAMFSLQRSRSQYATLSSLFQTQPGPTETDPAFCLTLYQRNSSLCPSYRGELWLSVHRAPARGSLPAPPGASVPCRPKAWVEETGLGLGLGRGILVAWNLALLGSLEVPPGSSPHRYSPLSFPAQFSLSFSFYSPFLHLL